MPRTRLIGAISGSHLFDRSSYSIMNAWSLVVMRFVGRYAHTNERLNETLDLEPLEASQWCRTIPNADRVF
jgi:hypothetical protein